MYKSFTSVYEIKIKGGRGGGLKNKKGLKNATQLKTGVL